jgi:glycosyltransferase involved in cell wall biosynthesis
MKVSVIVSNYNYAQFLPITIDSVLAQTYQDIEIMIVDDGSTDDSRNVISQLQQKAPDQIKTIFQENQGQGGAFNTGFNASSGEIIAFLDADDLWLPHKIQLVVDIFNDMPEIVGVMHPFNLIDGNGNILSSKKTRLISSKNLAATIIETGNAWHYPATSGLTYRRSTLQKLFPINQAKWPLCVDECLVFCTAFLGDIKTLDDVLASYRLHGSNNFIQPQTPEKILKCLARTKMTNQYINQFLEQINYPKQVDLSRNLQYRRAYFYLNKQWDVHEVLAISRSTLNWYFYTWYERIYYLTRFLIKSSVFLIHSIDFYGQKIS